MGKDNPASRPFADAETGVIQRYFRTLADACPGAFGLMDDAAIIEPPDGCDFVVTTDALIAGVHFFADDEPADIGFKALAVNVSDLAAKAASPIAYSIALALTRDLPDSWLAGFASGLGEAQSTFGIALSGGDTTVSPNGPIMISVTAFGSAPHGRMVRRSGAAAGDRLYVSGTIGDAALGLKLRRNDPDVADWPLDADRRRWLTRRYLRPEPRLGLRDALLAHASAAMDISDGLAIDCARLCAASGVSARIEADLAPLSPPAKTLLSADPALLETVLTGGDDYEILAVIPESEIRGFEAEASANKVPVAPIGVVENGVRRLKIVGQDGAPLAFSRLGYDHLA